GERDPGAGDERLEDDVRRARLGAVAARGRVETGDDVAGPRRDGGGERSLVHPRRRGTGDEGALRVLAVGGLERALAGAQGGRGGLRGRGGARLGGHRSEEHTSELQSRENLVCRLLREKKKNSRVQV